MGEWADAMPMIEHVIRADIIRSARIRPLSYDGIKLYIRRAN